MDEEQATFAGGCFWCMEPPFQVLDGVLKTEVGYAGGDTKNPTYGEVCKGTTGHAEAIQITYDPSKISYEKLLELFWHNIDPSQENGQFCDIGSQYRTVIFAHNKQQLKKAEASKDLLEKSGKTPIYTDIVLLKAFYPAEELHQKYYKKNAHQYALYHSLSGREKRLQEVWKETKRSR